MIYLGLALIILGIVILNRNYLVYQRRVISQFIAESGDSAQDKSTELQLWWKHFHNPPSGMSKRDVLDSQIDYWNARVQYRSVALWIALVGSIFIASGVLVLYFYYS